MSSSASVKIRYEKCLQVWGNANLRKDRQMQGIAMAKRKGVQFGRRKALNEIQVQEMRQKRQGGLLIKELMSHYGLSKATVYRALSEQ